MKKQFYTLAVLLALGFTANAQVGIGTITPDASSMLEVSSITKGLLMPRLTAAQMTAVATPATGLQIYNTTTKTFWYYNGTAWVNSAATTAQDLRLVGTSSHITSDAGTGSTGANTGSGAYNIGIGLNALNANTSGDNSQAIGLQALILNTTGAGNTAIGYVALGNNTTGGSNVALGNVAANNITTGSNNIAIGTNTSLASATASNQLNIGNTIYGTNIGTVNGRIGIGTTAPTAPFHVLSQVGGGDVVTFEKVSATGWSPLTIRQAKGTVAAPTAIPADAIYGSLAFNPYGTTGYNSGVGLNAYTTEAQTATAAGSALRFATTPNGTMGRVDKMILDQNGSVGIGTMTPFGQLANNAGNTVGSNGSGFNNAAGSFNWISGGAGFAAGIFNSNNAAGSGGLLVKVANNAASTLALDVSTNATQTTAGTPLLSVAGNGNVGIGTNSPANKLDIFGQVARIVNVNAPSLFTATNGTSDIRLQNNNGPGFVGSVTDNTFEIYANNLPRITALGNGNVGIGITPTAGAQLQLFGSVQNRKIVLFDAFNNDHQFYGFGVNSAMLRYQTDSPGSDHVFYAAINATSSKELVRIQGTGNMIVAGTITAPRIQGPSDSRFKKNIKPIENALDKVMKLGGYTYDWKDASEFPTQSLGKGHDMGVIAQEVEKQFPEAVTTNAEGFKAVSYTELVPALIEAIKELKAEVDALKSEKAKLQK